MVFESGLWQTKKRFEITKPLMAQIDRDKKFLGTFKRGHDENGHPVIPDRIKVNNGSVMAMAGHQDVLGVAAG